MARYCVIGHEAYQREWFDDKEPSFDSKIPNDGRFNAREHAKKLIKQSGGRTKELLVVKVVDIVRVSEPPVDIYPQSN